jgi:hypothetical protein
LISSGAIIQKRKDLARDLRKAKQAKFLHKRQMRVFWTFAEELSHKFPQNPAKSGGNLFSFFST